MTDSAAPQTPGSEPQAQQAGQPTGGGSELRAHNSPPVVGSAALWTVVSNGTHSGGCWSFHWLSWKAQWS